MIFGKSENGLPKIIIFDFFLKICYNIYRKDKRRIKIYVKNLEEVIMKMKTDIFYPGSLHG
jgi:hypothetical protein